MKNIIPYTHHAKYYETDQMGIIHHSNYIRWFEEARIDYLSQIGMPYRQLEEDGIISPVVGVECQYIQMMHFDDTATIQIEMTKYTGVRFEIDYCIYNQEGVLCTKGHSKHCFINKAGRPVSLKKENPKHHEILLSYLKTDKD